MSAETPAQHVEVPVPEESVEKVARLMFERGGLPAAEGTRFEDLPPGQQEGFRVGARIYLQAAAAFIAAKAVEEERDRRLEERDLQEERWRQALDFCLGSIGEYGEGTPEGKAYRSAYIFIERLAALDSEGGG